MLGKETETLKKGRKRMLIDQIRPKSIKSITFASEYRGVKKAFSKRLFHVKRIGKLRAEL